MSDNPYSSPQASVDTRPRTRRSKENGNEGYFKAARVHLALGILFGVLTFFAGIAAFPKPFDADPKFYVLMLSMLFVMVGFTGFHFLVWWGAKRRHNWARWLSLLWGLFSLAGFPIGTVIGIYLIGATWKRWEEPEYYEHITLEGWPGQPHA